MIYQLSIARYNAYSTHLQFGGSDRLWELLQRVWGGTRAEPLVRESRVKPARSGGLGPCPQRGPWAELLVRGSGGGGFAPKKAPPPKKKIK